MDIIRPDVSVRVRVPEEDKDDNSKEDTRGSWDRVLFVCQVLVEKLSQVSIQKYRLIG